MRHPFVGAFRACVPDWFNSEVGLVLPTYEDVTYFGRIGFSDDTVSYRTARSAAVSVARAACPDAEWAAATTWKYFLDVRHWLFDVSVRRNDRNDSILVSVSDDGAAALMPPAAGEDGIGAKWRAFSRKDEARAPRPVHEL